MSAAMTARPKFRPYVFKQQPGRWRVRVARGRWAQKQAIRSLRIALVARDLIDPDTSLEVYVVGEDPRFWEYEADGVFRARRTSVVGDDPLRILVNGDHVRITTGDTTYHQMELNSVAEVIEADYGTVNYGSRQSEPRILVRGVARNGADTANWLYRGDVAWTNDALTRPWI